MALALLNLQVEQAQALNQLLREVLALDEEAANGTS